MTRAVVVGGGVSGLAAARGLSDQTDEVVVLEASPRCGGKLAATELEGVRVDAGAESLLARRPEAVGLARSLGLGDRLVAPTPARPRVLLGDATVALPPSVLGVPSDVDALDGLLSPAGMARARQEPDLPAPPLAGDVAVGRLVDDRFGPEVTDRLLEPLLGGVYAGHARGLSFAAVNPALFEAARVGGPLSAHAAAVGERSALASGPVFAGLAGGLVGLVEALLGDLGDRRVLVRTGWVVRALARHGSGYELTTGPATTGLHRTGRTRADAVVLAAPAGPTGRLLGGLCPAAAEFATMPYASTAVLTLAVRGLGAPGSGLLVPPGQRPTIKAVTYSSAKWAWVTELAEGAWGPAASLVRVSVGRLGEEDLLQVDDETLLRRTFAEACTLPGWASVSLIAGVVSRWGGGLPQYAVGHRLLVGRLRAELDQHRGLAVCGAGLDGVGVAACLASADRAVAKVARDLASSPGGSGSDHR